MLFRFSSWMAAISLVAVAACGGGGDGGTGPGRDAGFDDPPDINPDISHLCDPGPNTFFVSPTGNDGADGLTMATAWKTMPATVGKLKAGQTACIAAGDYRLDGTLSITAAGDADHYISFV